MRVTPPRTILLCGTLVAAGCMPESLFESADAPLPAYCSARVEGSGQVDVETEYLPHVVQCENGQASFEALKAQAVAARSYLYYRLRQVGYIADGQSDQVFSCGRTPTAEHVAAVRETAGLVLAHAGSTVATFYVAGGEADAPDCTGEAPGVADTERYVTYNAGLAGGAVEPSPLGDAGSPQNRGCMSQNGADCLSDDGWRYDGILGFYYGQDAALMRAVGPCVDPDAAAQPLPDPEPEPRPDPDALPDEPVPDPGPESTPFNADCDCDVDVQCDPGAEEGKDCACDPDCFRCDCDVGSSCDADPRGCDCGCDADCGWTFSFNGRCGCDFDFECNADGWGCGCGCDPDCE